ncbi:MAG TPA: vitamin K epoxide reductase family protein [Candidatus Paceibacterota bacterium]|nr:vitamin K epoxide reductase family protein [Candidatus Paceibacterota bacterium]
MQTLIPIALSIVGLCLSAFMLFRKISHKKLSCPREHPCDTVLHSKFAKTFGLPNELLGIFYFLAILALIFLPLFGFSPVWDLYALFFLMIIGGLFSLYLLGLQAFVIKSWCAWCLGIAFTNILLIISLSSIPTEVFAPLLAKQKTLWVIVHNLGFILGVGSATITDIFFFRFLKDKVISLEEKETMDTLTSVIWVALAILVVSGFALFVPEQARLLASSKFLLKVFVVGVIIINGVLLNMFVGPYMRRLSFEGSEPAKKFRRLAFALGGVSFTSWYLAFLLGSLRKIHLDFQTALWAYLIIIVFVIIGSQIFERVVTKKFNKEPNGSDL